METLPVSARSPPEDAFPVPIEMIRALKTQAAAFSLSCSVSGLDDYEIADRCRMSHGYFSKIRSGQATLQAEIEPTFVAVVRNRIYAEWRAFQIGCTLSLLPTEAERRLNEREAQLAEAEARIEALTKQVHGGVGPALVRGAG